MQAPTVSMLTVNAIEIAYKRSITYALVKFNKCLIVIMRLCLVQFLESKRVALNEHHTLACYY